MLRPVTFVAAAVVLLGLPFFVNDYVQYVINLVLVYGLVAVGFNIVLGYLGQLAFANTAFFGVGAYALGILMERYGLPFWAALLPAGHHIDRLADDHANARALARGLAQIDGVEVQQPETNLVFFKPDGAGISGDKMVGALRKRGVLLAVMDGRIRACTHLDVTAEMIEETVGLVREIVRGV